MSSLFDPNTFLAGIEVEGSMSTKVPTVPLGRYNMQIKDFIARRVIPEDSGKKPFTTLEVTCSVPGDAIDQTGKPVKETTGRDENLVRYKCFLDFVEGSNALAIGDGQNVGLGKLRAAVGQNNPNQKWGFNMLRGQVFNGEVFHVQDKKDPEKVYAEVRNPLPPQ